ncbi:MAG TPA: trypsin-like peptidase domain-containing protein [Anaeromyxobacter sp.]|nr:trypsin-like peptidase domain-containing protein [Anaeromyxobacter sp.]
MDPLPRPPRAARHAWLVPFALGLLAAVLLVQLFSGWPRLGGGPPAEPRPVTPRGDLAEDEKATIELFRRASPSVVFITTLARQQGFFEIQEVPAGAGSGFVWDAQGHVVTNFHVIRGASAARVSLHDRSEWPATLVGVAPDQDLAVLRIRAPADRLVPILVGTSRDLHVGQKVFAIGNPFGLDFTLTTGIVSALGRSIPALTGRRIDDVIQTDAAINPGNSGGPLLDSAGRLVGVNTQIASPSGASAGVGFAVPVDTVNRVVPQVVEHGRVVRPQIGITAGSEQALRRAGIGGVLVMSVAEGSPAERAGLRGTYRTEDGTLVLGDIVQGIDREEVSSVDDLYAALERREPGDVAKVRVLRDGRPLELDVKLAAPRE